jgi:hypothetical protein
MSSPVPPPQEWFPPIPPVPPPQDWFPPIPPPQDWIDPIVDPIKEVVIDPIEAEAKRIAAEAERIAKETAAAIEQAANESIKWVSDVNARTENIKAIAQKAEAELKKAGVPVDQFYKEFVEASNFMQAAVIAGVEGVEWVVQYLEQNICQISLSSALSICFFIILNPAEPTANTTAMPVTLAAIAYMAAGVAADQTAKLALAGACYAFAMIIVEPIYAIPEVRNGLGKSGKDILTSALGNALYYGIEANAAAYTTTATALVMMSAAFSILIANLICTGTLPGGYKVMYGINDGYDKNFTPQPSPAPSPAPAPVPTPAPIPFNPGKTSGGYKCINDLPTGWSKKAPSGMMYTQKMSPTGIWCYGPNGEREAAVNC